VICLLSKHWEASHECKTEFRYAENLNEIILCARLEPIPDTGITSEWQRCDLFPAHGATTSVDIADGGQPVVLSTVGVQRLLEALHALGIGAEHFPWPPPGDLDRAPYRGWAPLEEVDAAVFSGRDAQIVQGLDVLRGMRSTGVQSLLVILGPSGAGKSSFLRAGLLPRLRRDDRHFLPLEIVRPERAVLTGELGLAQALQEGVTPGLIVAVTIRADRYEPLQIAPELAEAHSVWYSAEEGAVGPSAGWADAPRVGRTGSSCNGEVPFTTGRSSDGYAVWSVGDGALADKNPVWAAYRPPLDAASR
jgi:hypothetical protein